MVPGGSAVCPATRLMDGGLLAVAGCAQPTATRRVVRVHPAGHQLAAIHRPVVGHRRNDSATRAQTDHAQRVTCQDQTAEPSMALRLVASRGRGASPTIRTLLDRTFTVRTPRTGSDQRWASRRAARSRSSRHIEPIGSRKNPDSLRHCRGSSDANGITLIPKHLAAVKSSCRGDPTVDGFPGDAGGLGDVRDRGAIGHQPHTHLPHLRVR